MRESKGASMQIDETCLARVQVAREWRESGAGVGPIVDRTKNSREIIRRGS